MELFETSKLDIYREFENERRKIEEATVWLISKKEEKILKLKKDMEERFKKIDEDQQKALELVECKIMKKLISEAILKTPNMAFKDLHGFTWQPKEPKWSEGRFVKHIFRPGGIARSINEGRNYTWMSDIYDPRTITFSPEMIEAELNKENITYEFSDDPRKLDVFVNPPNALASDFHSDVVHPKMTFFLQ
jgi:hypothetical protein